MAIKIICDLCGGKAPGSPSRPRLTITLDSTTHIEQKWDLCRSCATVIKQSQYSLSKDFAVEMAAVIYNLRHRKLMDAAKKEG